MSGPQIITFAVYPAPEIVDAYMRRAHHVRAAAFTQALRALRDAVKRRFAAPPRFAVKRSQPRLILPRRPVLH